jgi:hypothetical protein
MGWYPIDFGFAMPMLSDTYTSAWFSATGFISFGGNGGDYNEGAGLTSYNPSIPTVFLAARASDSLVRRTGLILQQRTANLF